MPTPQKLRILLTGATGYIGKRLLPVLLEAGHEVICCVRDADRFAWPKRNCEQITLHEVDFLADPEPDNFPEDIDVAYYLIHSMSASTNDFVEQEARCARNFRTYMHHTWVSQVVYLGGIGNQKELSDHLASRKKVGDILRDGNYATTTLQAGIIVGSGSASFEIIRDLVEKLPVMIVPKWTSTRSEPVAIRDVITALLTVAGKEKWFNEILQIGGPEKLTYQEMMETFADVRGLKRKIYPVPFLSPRLSSYWLFLMTSTTYNLAVNLVDSMKVEVLTQPNRLPEILGHRPIRYRRAVQLAFIRVKQDAVASSWIDSFGSSGFPNDIEELLDIPEYGCFEDKKSRKIPQKAFERVRENVWSIGGSRGWYYGNWMWQIRGILDKMVGGIGLRRGRRHPSRLRSGDTLDFWRVLVADKKNNRLVLFAEMKLPGEAWLEFCFDEMENGGYCLTQKATFRPKGIWGRMYWWSVYPFHLFVFDGMINGIVRHGRKQERKIAKAQQPASANSARLSQTESPV